MKDYFGRELEVGQLVVYVYASGSSVRKRSMYVVGFSKEQVRISKNLSDSGGCVQSTSLIILSEEGVHV